MGNRLRLRVGHSEILKAYEAIQIFLQRLDLMPEIPKQASRTSNGHQEGERIATASTASVLCLPRSTA
jgi:hypothetical protein